MNINVSVIPPLQNHASIHPTGADIHNYVPQILPSITPSDPDYDPLDHFLYTSSDKLRNSAIAQLTEDTFLLAAYLKP